MCVYCIIVRTGIWWESGKINGKRSSENEAPADNEQTKQNKQNRQNKSFSGIIPCHPSAQIVLRGKHFDI